MPRLALPLLAVCLLPACASSRYPSLDEPLPPKARAVQAPAANAPGTLSRADVERVVDAGLGRFLSHVLLEPRIVSGKFTGWSIVELRPQQLWQGIDLQPGDVVTKVNGMAIERETEAFDAFQAVREAPAIEVSYLRGNEPRTLRLTIVGAPSPSLPQAAPSSPAPAPAPSAAHPG